jgi:hypothetical protein
MKSPKNQCPGDGSRKIRNPVVRIISAPPGSERLVILIQPTHQTHDDHRYAENQPPSGSHRIPAEQASAQQAGPAEKESKVLELIDMSHRRDISSGQRGGGNPPQNTEPKQEARKPKPRVAENLRHPHSLRISSSSRSASHCFIID